VGDPGPGGAIADFETGYSNPAMAQMIGVPTEASADGRTAKNEELLERVHQTHARARSLVDGILESPGRARVSRRSPWTPGRWWPTSPLH
jgi:hypothetical protein